MAAGLGSRLGHLTEQLPKALIRVADVPLLEHALRFASQLAPTHVVVVGGFCFPDVAAEAERIRFRYGLPLTVVENQNFRRGNLLSLMAARPHLNDDFVLLNVDHIFNPAIAPLVATTATEITAFVDTDRKLGDDDMKVQRDAAGHIHKIAKTLPVFDAGYVGMTKVPKAESPRYWEEVDRALAAEGDAIHVERVVARLAETARPPACRDISGHGWLEVDTPSERAAAEEALRNAHWS